MPSDLAPNPYLYRMTTQALQKILNGEGRTDVTDYTVHHAFSEGVAILAKYLADDDYWFGEEICLFGKVDKIAPFITRDDAQRLAVLGWFIDEEHRGDGEGHFAIYS